MEWRFDKHYTREEAQALLPQVRQWLAELSRLREQLARLDEWLGKLLAAGNDIGGELVNDWIRTLASLRRVLVEFQRREIQLKDLDRGLVDFPAIIGGREVFLCWEKDEAAIEYWHDLETGYAGREKLD
jgi:hypothetical protein